MFYTLSLQGLYMSCSFGCSEVGHAGSWSQSGRYREQGELENSNSLRQPLKRDKLKGEHTCHVVYKIIITCNY